MVRHGESLWNLDRKYTGWANIGLTQLGIRQAKDAGMLIRENKLNPSVIYTSDLVRCYHSSKIIRQELKSTIPIVNNWRLNEKHYGMLTGYSKDKNFYPKENYFTVPPVFPKQPMIDSLMTSYSYDECSYYPFYGESYYMTKLRVLPVMNILKNSKEKSIIICSHKNTIKVIMQMLEKKSNEETIKLKVPNSIPIIYEMDDKLSKLLSKKTLVKK